MTNTTTFEIGKTYKQSWEILGHRRTARFTVEAFAKNGKARGTYIDADGRKYARHFESPQKAAEWTPA